MSSHYQREGTYACRPQDVGIAGGLGSSLHCPLVYGTKFVHVVALVAAAAGIHEREHAGNEQGALVVRDGKRAGKDGAGLAVLLVAVAEE